jgi:hypothetical protein
MGYSPKRLYDGMEKPEIGMLSVAFDSRAVGKMYKIGFCSWLYIVHIYVLCTSLLRLLATKGSHELVPSLGVCRLFVVFHTIDISSKTTWSI